MRFYHAPHLSLKCRLFVVRWGKVAGKPETCMLVAIKQLDMISCVDLGGVSLKPSWKSLRRIYCHPSKDCSLETNFQLHASEAIVIMPECRILSHLHTSSGLHGLPPKELVWGRRRKRNNAKPRGGQIEEREVSVASPITVSALANRTSNGNSLIQMFWQQEVLSWNMFASRIDMLAESPPSPSCHWTQTDGVCVGYWQ